jgi:hypothetical protein
MTFRGRGRNGRGIMQGAILEFSWRDWVKSRNHQVRISNLQAEIWTQDLQNIKQEFKPLDYDVPFLCKWLSNSAW